MSEAGQTTLHLILSAAMQEFLEKGYKSASLRNIVKTAGVTTGAFYGYYDSKEDLFEALVGEHYNFLLERFCKAQKEFAEKLGMTTVGLAQIIAGKPSYTTLEKIADALEVEIWELLISKGEIVGKSNAASLTCPHCGKSITLKAE